MTFNIFRIFVKSNNQNALNMFLVYAQNQYLSGLNPFGGRIDIATFKYKKDAIEFYNYLKNDLDDYVSKHGYCNPVELTQNMNKTGYLFQIRYQCLVNINQLLYLEVCNRSDSYYKDHWFDYCNINGENVQYDVWQEQVWKEQFPDLFTNVMLPPTAKSVTDFLKSR